MMVTGGYRHLVDVLSAPLSDDVIFLDHNVARIRVDGEDGEDGETSQVVVETTDGTTFEGSHVIVTVPIGVLKAGSISFDPPLPPTKRDAIDPRGRWPRREGRVVFRASVLAHEGQPTAPLLQHP